MSGQADYWPRAALRISRTSERIRPRGPRFQFRLDFFLPRLVTGPVDRVHGCQRLIASACLARASAVHLGI